MPSPGWDVVVVEEAKATRLGANDGDGTHHHDHLLTGRVRTALLHGTTLHHPPQIKDLGNAT